MKPGRGRTEDWKSQSRTFSSPHPLHYPTWLRDYSALTLYKNGDLFLGEIGRGRGSESRDWRHTGSAGEHWVEAPPVISSIPASIFCFLPASPPTLPPHHQSLQFPPNRRLNDIPLGNYLKGNKNLFTLTFRGISMKWIGPTESHHSEAHQSTSLPMPPS